MSKVLAVCLTIVTLACCQLATAAVKPPVTLNVSYTNAPGGTGDQLLSSGALASSVLDGLRESGVAVVLNAPEANIGVQLNLTALYSPPLDNLRVISGTMADGYLGQAPLISAMRGAVANAAFFCGARARPRK